MPRKLIHAFRALSVALCLLTAGLIAGAPTPETVSAVSVGTVASVAPTTEAERAEDPQAKPLGRHRRGQSRESLALPFFSFAHGLRGGNRS